VRYRGGVCGVYIVWGYFDGWHFNFHVVYSVGVGYFIEKKAYVVIRKSNVALTVREICVLINGVDMGYCRNVDGNGAHCRYAYHRTDAENGYELKIPKCRYKYTDVSKILKMMSKNGKIKRIRLILRDRLSKWGFDRFVLYYIDDDQLYKRIKTKPLYEY